MEEVFVKVCGSPEVIRPESHKPLGTPLSSPATPLVPLVVEWKVATQVQTTWSPALMETTAGENLSAGFPTVTWPGAKTEIRGKAKQTRNRGGCGICFVKKLIFIIILVSSLNYV